MEETKFDRFNLLVGASGVGKTRILEAILNLRLIASKGDIGENWIQGEVFTWEVSFKTQESAPTITWMGGLGEVEERQGKTSYQVLREEIRIRERVIVTRTGGEVKLQGKSTPKLSKHEGIISILREEDEIKPIFEAFSRIWGGHEQNFEESWFENFQTDKYVDFVELRSSSESLRYKLWWAYSNPDKTDVFRDLTTQFLEIFPNFRSFSMGTWDLPSARKSEPTTVLLISLAERNTDFELELDYVELATGMQRTLDILGQIYLLPDNSLILIDEFENSLGANCIDLVAEAVQNAGRGLQFIITSHHPYIINRIGAKHWKIVTRKGGVVTTHTAEELGIGRSRHENFSQLTQLEAFQTGVMSE